jgi:hypothetical protein
MSGLVRLCQVRSGLGEVISGYVRLGHVISSNFKIVQFN